LSFTRVKLHTIKSLCQLRVHVPQLEEQGLK
jgi:hypothetical protein